MYDVIRTYASALVTAQNIQIIAFRGRSDNTNNANINSRELVDETFTSICSDTGTSGTETMKGTTTEYFRFSLSFNYTNFCYEDAIFGGVPY